MAVSAENLSTMDRLPVYLRKPMFEKLFQIAEYTNLTKEEKRMYDGKRMYQWDNENALEYAEEKGIEKGERKKAVEIAGEMKKEGFPVEQIAKFTKLSAEEINSL